MATQISERTLEETPTWAVAVVCFFLVAISIFIEHLIHMVGAWFKKKHKRALFEALEKIKAELMLMGFLSLLLTITQNYISQICIPAPVAATWHPCNKNQELSKYKNLGVMGRKLYDLDLEDDLYYDHRRSLATKGYDKCADKGKVALVSAYGIHQLHVFIFVLAVFHILYCIITYALGSTKMKKWKVWEDETKTIEYQFTNDPERFRFARDTSFGRRHLNFWSRSSFTLWIVCFFRQFFKSVTKVDYLTLRHGFIMAHLAPGSETTFDFQKYIKRSLEEDFKVVVGISPLIWFCAVLFLLTNTHGIYSHLWLPFIPLIIILVVGAKLQVIITKLGLTIQEKGDVVKGAPVVQPGDKLFWFGRPRFILFLIHLVLFTNGFQLAFFAWSSYEFTIRSCFHQKLEDIIIRLSMGVLIQILCSYVTLPLYALVTQMGSTMKPTIFNDRVAAALRSWHHTAKRHTKHGKHSGTNTPMSSRPTTPTHGMSPVHLLHNYNHRSLESFPASPMHPDYDHNNHWDHPDSSHSPQHRHLHHETSDSSEHVNRDQPRQLQEPVAFTELPPGPGPIRTQHEINISLSDFTFKK